ncbi:hypothetical protein D4A92_00265 [Rhizobium rosettiformans]|uniref:Mu-like prophage I protein n=1 Tax=Rhizobium rosettiformans TaxID=1368430 RepID=A0ABX7ES49_9HYPH|nr:phage protease [Rhizobium rosettiformans]QRF49986.1 hypothetical protein D4A92_00265 [Rhizobium rosettiformans]
MDLSLQTSTAQAVSLASTEQGERQQWVQLVTLGSMKTVDGRGPYIVDNAKAVISRSFQNISTDKLPIDYEHAIDKLAPQGLPAPAAGWISQMEARADGIWGLVEWTPKAAQQVKDKEFRFLSPVLFHTKDFHVLSIARASLTNNPNLTLKSLNAAEKGLSMDYEKFMSDLRTALGLPATADADTILQTVKTSKSMNSADPAQFVPIDMFQQTVAELHKLRSGISLQAAEVEVDAHIKGGKLLPFMRDWAVSLCQVNKAAFDDFLGGAGKPVVDFMTGLQSSHDFSKQRERDQGGSPEVTDVHRNLGLSAEDVKAYGGKADK